MCRNKNIGQSIHSFLNAPPFFEGNQDNDQRINNNPNINNNQLLDQANNKYGFTFLNQYYLNSP